MDNGNPQLFKTVPARGAALGLLVGVCLMCACSAWSSEIVLQLSGDVEYPGVLSLKKGENQIKRLCLVGVQGQEVARFGISGLGISTRISQSKSPGRLLLSRCFWETPHE